MSLLDDGLSVEAVFNMLAPVVFAYFFAAFWLPWLRSPLGYPAAVLFIAAAFWEAYSWASDRRRTNEDPELNHWEKLWFKALFPAFVLPAYVISGIAVFRVYLVP